ncbi:DUF3429 domain-containing protein [Sulfitobacter aestuarii]|uniref:DUF3429 domain-containing protein n=1 Tax=Sulfitobacter aestuarii TaxID=2161676 RepID=A0ABW5TWX8_9RHOB
MFLAPLKRVPAPALILGFAGLLPFLWAAMLLLGVDGGISGRLPRALGTDGRLVMLRYGSVILPFMSGVLWGFATRARGTRAAAAYALSTLPALWWFFAPGAGPSSALLNLMSGFAGLLILDFAFWRWSLAPSWWMALRLPLSIVVLACLGLALWLT